MIGLSSLFSFGLFVNNAESVNKHFDYVFSYFCYDLQLYECIIAAATASSSLFFGHVCFRSRKSALVFDPVCLQPKRRTDGRTDEETQRVSSSVRPSVRSFVSLSVVSVTGVRPMGE